MIVCRSIPGIDNSMDSFAYIEFAEPDFVNAAVALNESLFRNRLLKVYMMIQL